MKTDKIAAEAIQFRQVTDKDTEFLYHVYSSTRNTEMAITGWSEREIEAFLKMQFKLQHTQYTGNYPGASFNIITIDGAPAGRLYVDRKGDRILIIDITLLPEFRGKGAGGMILMGLIDEADAKGLMMALHVEMNNPILPFYRSIGFRKIKLEGIYYYMEREVMQKNSVKINA